MKLIQLVKPGLFLYECLRIPLLAAVLILRSERNDILISLVYAAPSALFPLMALFIWLDSERYRAYLPLFAAGKCIGISTILGWSIVSAQVTMIGVFMTVVVFAEFVILCGDLLAMAAVYLVYKNNKKNNEINAVTNTEGSRCE
jgi:membrane-bound metal-dependent hydrolase YbcI (DUF457 family)